MLKKLIPLVLITFLSACACPETSVPADCCCQKAGVQCPMKEGKECCCKNAMKEGKQCPMHKDGKKCCDKHKAKSGKQCPMKGKQAENEENPSE